MALAARCPASSTGPLARRPAARRRRQVCSIMLANVAALVLFALNAFCDASSVACGPAGSRHRDRAACAGHDPDAGRGLAGLEDGVQTHHVGIELTPEQQRHGPRANARAPRTTPRCPACRTLGRRRGHGKAPRPPAIPAPVTARRCRAGSTARRRRSCRVSPTRDVKCDVCVVGAGIAGLTTAYLLAREGRAVVVVDQGTAVGAGGERAHDGTPHGFPRRSLPRARAAHGEQWRPAGRRSATAAISAVEDHRLRGRDRVATSRGSTATSSSAGTALRTSSSSSSTRRGVPACRRSSCPGHPCPTIPGPVSAFPPKHSSTPRSTWRVWRPRVSGSGSGSMVVPTSTRCAAVRRPACRLPAAPS